MMLFMKLKRKKINRLAAVALSAVFSSAAMAVPSNAADNKDIAFPACTASNGKQAEYHAIPSQDFRRSKMLLAAASIIDDRALIFYDKDNLHRLSPDARQYVLAHECYHLRAGHSEDAAKKQQNGEHISHDTVMKNENETICAISKELNFNTAQINAVFTEIKKVADFPFYPILNAQTKLALSCLPKP